MADSVKDILRGFDQFSSSNAGGDIESRGHSTGVQAPKTNNVDCPSVVSRNAVKSETPSQSSQKVPIQRDQQISSGVAACLTMFEILDENVLLSGDSPYVGKSELNSIDKNYADLSYDVDGPNALFFGEDRSAGSIAKDRGERVRQLRERQQVERQQKLQELKDQAASAQKFREQQEQLRRQRHDEMRQKDNDRRTQVEERRRLIETAELERKESALRRNSDRDSRQELKRKQERSNVVFAFGSSTPRMLDPKESSYGYWGSRKATSSSNVNVPDSSTVMRRPDLAATADLSRKRATSAHSLNRKPDDLKMSSSMYEVFNWDSTDGNHAPPGTRLTKSRDSSLERRTRAEAQRSLASSPKPAKNLPFFTCAPSRFSVWEFGDNFCALGPSGQIAQNPQLDSPISSISLPLASLHSAPDAASGDDIMSRSMSATTPTAARRRTDLFPVLPSARSAATAKGGKHRSTGMPSGSATPNSSSRPTSALSQGSSGNQVTLRSKMTTRKPRPLSIAGSSFSSADKPRSNASAGLLSSRESRPIEKKSSTSSVPPAKLTRAKSVGGSDSNVTASTKNYRTTSTPKRTPAQVKAESAARKAAEKSKTAQKRQPSQVTPLASPAVPSRPLPSQSAQGEGDAKPELVAKDISDEVVIPSDSNAEPGAQPMESELTSPSVEPMEVKETEHPIQDVKQTETEVQSMEVKQTDPQVQDVKQTEQEVTQTEQEVTQPEHLEIAPVSQPEAPNDTKEHITNEPVTGYASKEDYKAALAENRRLAREAKEKELEMERQQKLEEAEKERKEEEDYLRLMEEQKAAEEERLKKAIEEAEKQREIDNKRKEEEELQRLEAEKLEKQKQAEAAEKMRKEEIERQARKSRVAAIMSRTRGKGASKGDDKSLDELRVAENLAMSDSFMANISSTMSDSMIVEAIESRRNEDDVEVVTDDRPIIAAVQEIETVEHLNGGTCLESSEVELIGSVNGDVHNGTVQNGETNATTGVEFDSFDPFSPVHQTTKTESQNFEQIIDLNQSKLTNEDAVNSNPPPPIIAFEENLNKKQIQDSSSVTVTDLLL